MVVLKKDGLEVLKMIFHFQRNYFIYIFIYAINMYFIIPYCFITKDHISIKGLESLNCKTFKYPFIVCFT